MPLFTFPLALMGLAAAPALVAIYWFRSRARIQRTPSLLLWMNEKQRWDGGRRLERLQTPLLFFLELLTIILLSLAAAGPVMRAAERGRSLIVVLDDSFSMLAGAEENVRVRAEHAIESEAAAGGYESIRFVLAGETPQLLGQTSGGGGQVRQLLQNWRCGAADSKLDEAIAFAFELGAARTRVLAITDRAPASELSDGRLQWWAFGKPAANLAFVNAARTRQDNEERVLLEIANLSAQSETTTLTIESQAPQTLRLGAGETKRIVFSLKPDSPVIKAALERDGLLEDNEVLLSPAPLRMVRTELRVSEPSLHDPVERALRSLSDVILTSDAPQLILTDASASNQETGDAWILRLSDEADAASFLGPFVMDRAHPLTEGLSLGGVVWAAGRSTSVAGAPVITAGNIPLLTDLSRSANSSLPGRHELLLRLRSRLSTLQQTPNFPILLANLIRWRGDSAPGLRESNIRLGSEANLVVASNVGQATVVPPNGVALRLPAQDNRLLVKADQKGVYSVTADGTQYRFTANALNRSESDLRAAASGRWGDWTGAATLQWEYRSIAWAFLLPALAALATHAWLTRRQAR